MAGKPGFLQYLTAAFNARPFGMFVAPNWVGLAAAGLLGLADPGFWVLGAGLELGYLLVLATNERFRRTVTAARSPTLLRGDDWTARIGKALLALGERDRLRYQTIAERCRSIIDLQDKQLSSGPSALASSRSTTALRGSRGCTCGCCSCATRSRKCRKIPAAAKDLPGAIALLEATARRRKARWRAASQPRRADRDPAPADRASGRGRTAARRTSTPSSRASSSRSS